MVRKKTPPTKAPPAEPEDADHLVFVKLPESLVARCVAVWDRILDTEPLFRAAAPRRGATAAIRMLLELQLRRLEAQ